MPTTLIPACAAGCAAVGKLRRSIPRDNRAIHRIQETFGGPRVIAEGLSNVDVGLRLYCSEATVKSHVRSMLTKLQMSNRVQLVIFAYESRLISA